MRSDNESKILRCSSNSIRLATELLQLVRHLYTLKYEARASTLNVSLTSNLQNYVDSKVRKGWITADPSMKYSEKACGFCGNFNGIGYSANSGQNYDPGQSCSRKAEQAANGELIDGEIAMQKILDELSPTPKRSKKARRS